MECYPVFTSSKNTEESTGCFYRFVYGRNDTCLTHSHDYYEIFLTETGQVHHWINGETQILPEGSLVFIRPFDTHGYLYPDARSRQSNYINLAFTKEIADSLFSFLSEDGFSPDVLLNAPAPPMVVLSSTEKKRLLSLLGELNTINWQNKKALKLRLKVILADIFAQHFFHLPERDTLDAPHWFKHLLREMEQPEHFAVGAQRMVALSGKSYEHLARVIKQHLDMTLTQYINTLRVNYAANLLLNSNHSVADICYLCGFQNLGYFYKVFKREYGLAPAQFVACLRP